MDKLIMKKRKCVDEASRSEVMDDETNSDSPLCLKTAQAVAGKSKFRRSYHESYLSYGFTCCYDEYGQKPKCVVCGTVLSNEALVPNKMKRHLTTKHSHLSDKPLDYFKKLLNENEPQMLPVAIDKNITKSEKAKKASYLVAELIAKNMKAHTIAESIILPSCCAIVRTMFGAEAEKQVKKIPLSDSTISRRIQQISYDIEKNVCNVVKEKGMYSLQLDEWTDNEGKVQLLVFIRYIDGSQITQQYLCYMESLQTTEQDVFSAMSIYLTSVDLTWKSCVGICIDSTSMVTSLTDFVSLVKIENPDLIITHCFMHREKLVAETLGNDLKSVLNDVIKMVNCIKGKKSRLFALLCEEMESVHISLLYTMDRWLSRGRVLSQVHNIKQEIINFFTLEGKPEYCELLADDTWCEKLCYLSDIFEILNNLSISMKGSCENMLSCCDKMKTLAEKLKVWNIKVQQGNLDMFKNTADAKNTDIIPLISEHLENLKQNITNYLPNICIENYDWVINPFILEPLKNRQLSMVEEEELTDIFHNKSLLLKHMEMSLETFWIHIEDQFPHLAKKAQIILLQFSNSHMCELGFSNLITIRNMNRSRLSVDEELRVCLSNVSPDILCTTDI